MADEYTYMYSFLPCTSAVFFEMQKWEECIKQCEEAVEKGRELRADFKVIAKCVVSSIWNVLVSI